MEDIGGINVLKQIDMKKAIGNPMALIIRGHLQIQQ